MRSKSLVVRTCAIAIALIHLAMFVSVVVPSVYAQRERLWQALRLQHLPAVFHQRPLEVVAAILWQALGSHPVFPPALFHQPPSLIVAAILFLPLVLPPLALWAAARSPVRMSGLVSVWSSLPLLFVAWLFWSLQIYFFRSLSGLVVCVASLGFALSFILSLVVARCLRLLLDAEANARAMSQSNRLLSAQQEHARHVRPSKGETRPEQADTGHSWLGFAFPTFLIVLSLLCYLLIFRSLSFPYTDIFDPYDGTFSPTPGWQLVPRWVTLAAFTAFPLAVLVPVVFPYFMPFNSVQNKRLLFMSVVLNCALNILGFLSSSLVLFLVLLLPGGDLYDPIQSIDGAFGIPPAAFLLALICSNVLLGHVLQHRSGAKLR